VQQLERVQDVGHAIGLTAENSTRLFMLKITPLYAALLAIVFVVLSIRTIRLRRRLQVAIGDGGNPQMLRAMRVQANFAEYVPFALLLLSFAELQGATALRLHLLAACLVVGRISHAYGVSQLKEKFAFRITGMVLTFVCLLSSASVLLLPYLQALVA
jgi:uncharacterized protein